MKQTFTTFVGAVEISLDEQSRVMSVYRFDAEGRPGAAAMESWDHADLAALLFRQMGVPASEAHEIAAEVGTWGTRLGPAPAPADWRDLPPTRDQSRAPLEPAGLALRFVAVLLDGI